MVMIPVGNDTKHNFGLWCFVEIYIRLIISSVVCYRVIEVGLSDSAYWFLLILFTLWSWRPLYLNLKSLYNSWKLAKHKAESDALSELGADK